MTRLTRKIAGTVLALFAAASVSLGEGHAPARAAASAPAVSVAELVDALRAKAKSLEDSAGMKRAFQLFVAAHQLPPESIGYSDFVLIRLLFEATWDAGLWNLHWQITDQPPNSDRIWQQWAAAGHPSFSRPTAIAECDELSALYAFLVERAGVKSVGLFWPAPNHTVAVWVLKPTAGSAIRIVVPTTQIFLEETDFFDTRKFNPWRQKTIYEYTRRDVPDSFALPKPLAEFFLKQIDKYAGASDTTLQRLRYERDAVLSGSWTTEQAARDALQRRATLAPRYAQDTSAYQVFADDMRLESLRQ